MQADFLPRIAVQPSKMARRLARMDCAPSHLRCIASAPAPRCEW